MWKSVKLVHFENIRVNFYFFYFFYYSKLFTCHGMRFLIASVVPPGRGALRDVTDKEARFQPAQQIKSSYLKCRLKPFNFKFKRSGTVDRLCSIWKHIFTEGNPFYELKLYNDIRRFTYFREETRKRYKTIVPVTRW